MHALVRKLKTDINGGYSLHDAAGTDQKHNDHPGGMISGTSPSLVDAFASLCSIS
jgi:hypothetical protein